MGTTNTHITHICHDWDDTIVASFDEYQRFYQNFARYHRLVPPDTETIRGHWGTPVPELLHLLYPQYNSEDIRLLFTEFWRQDTYPHNYRPHPFENSIETLHTLSKHYTLSIITSSGKKNFFEQYIRLFPTQIHTHIFCKEDCEYHKPDPRAFEPLLIATHYPPESILYIGDSLHDYASAKGNNIKFVAVTTGVTTREQFLNAGIDARYILDSFTGLLPLL